jgi:hypothetical protein
LEGLILFRFPQLRSKVQKVEGVIEQNLSLSISDGVVSLGNSYSIAQVIEKSVDGMEAKFEMSVEVNDVAKLNTQNGPFLSSLGHFGDLCRVVAQKFWEW